MNVTSEMTTTGDSVWRLAGALLLFSSLSSFADTKIVIRHSNSNVATPTTETRFFQGQRIRVQFGPAGATILQCDLHKAVTLYSNFRLFLTLDLDSDGRPIWPGTPAYFPKQSTERRYDYTITTKDMGERATVFGLPSWHVQDVTVSRDRITGVTNQTVTDYWYVDLKVPSGCGDSPSDFNEYLISNAKRLGVTLIGQAKRGFPVLARRVSFMGNKKLETVRQVTELSTDALDSKLFDPPADFKPVLQMRGKVYSSLADTPANRVKVGWNLFWESAASWLP
jgi:hypothetical protein